MRSDLRAALGTAAVLVGGALSIGCQTVTVQAPNTINPVLLGPVHKIGGGDMPVGEEGELYTSSSQLAAASSSTTQQGNVQVTTTSSQHSQTAATQNDFDVALASDGKADIAFATDQIDCDVYAFIFLGAVMFSNKCEIYGGSIHMKEREIPPLVDPGKKAKKKKKAEEKAAE